jgi:hypothetical protein
LSCGARASAPGDISTHAERADNPAMADRRVITCEAMMRSSMLDRRSASVEHINGALNQILMMRRINLRAESRFCGEPKTP